MCDDDRDPFFPDQEDEDQLGLFGEEEEQTEEQRRTMLETREELTRAHVFGHDRWKQGVVAAFEQLCPGK